MKFDKRQIVSCLARAIFKNTSSLVGMKNGITFVPTEHNKNYLKKALLLHI